MYILRPDLTEEQQTAAVERYSEFLTRNGAAIEKTDRWGRRKLAYEIKGYADGIYVVVTFTGTGTVGNEVQRYLGIQEDVLRSMVVRLPE